MFKGLAVLLFLLLGVAVQGQTVSIQANVPTALESGSVPGQFRVFTFFTVVSPDITVNYTVSGTANPGGDYTALSGTITLSGIVAGTSENFIDVTGIVDDANIEGDETVIVTLTSASGLGSIAPPPNNTATVTIKDNDGATVAFSSAAGSGPENAGTGIPTLLVNGTVVNPTTVSLTTGGTATAADYALASPTITIPAGIYTNGTIPLGLTITGDAVVEPNETVVLSLTSPTGDAILAPPTTTTYTIQNDDLVTIRIDDPPSVPEGNSNVQTLTFTVGIDQADPTAQVRVNYTISGGNENGTSNTLTFLDGTTVLTQTIDVTTNGDLVLEPDEPVTVTLSNPSANAVLAPNPDNVGTSSFTNDDTASLSIADATVAEDVAGGNMVFTVTLNNAVLGGTTVAYSFTDGTATGGGVDYTGTPSNLTFTGTANETQTITVPIVDDNIVEGTETFTVQLGTPTNGVTLGKGSATGTITDDDTANLSIADATVAEDVAGGNMVFTVTLNNAVSGGTTVAYSFTDGTATGGGVDYTGTPSNLTFTGTANETQTITVPIVDDNIVEGTETFTVQLGTPTNGVTLAKGTATGTITDDDTASLSIADATVAEDVAGGNMVFTVTLNNAVSGGTTVAYTFTDGTATGGGVDYTGTAGSLDFTGTVAGQTRTITVPIVDDNIVEGNETFTVQLGTPTNGVTLGKGSATGTITDDDTASLSIADATVAEDVAGGNMVFTVTLNNAVSGGTTVVYTFTDGTATGGGVDYTGTAGSLDFTGTVAGQTRTITVPIVNDNIVEGTETFTVQLGTPTNGVTLGKGSATGTITDDDTASLSIADATVAEDVAGGNMVFTVTLNNAVSGGTTVAYSFTDGTATGGGVDYTGTAGSLDFTGTVAGQTRTITVPIVDDNIVEGNETFTLQLGTPTNGVTLGKGSATGTITDNDTASLSIADATVAEDVAGGNMVFTVTLNNAVSGGTSVTYSFTDGTATGGGVDYTDTPSNLTFTGTANETQTITVPIVDDNIVEGNETFTVQLGTPTNGVTLAKGSATGTITNDDTGVAIQTTGVSHPEGNSGTTAFAFTVTRTGNLSGSTNVAYTVTGSGANPADGTDFAGGTLPANSVNFTAGSATATITINVNGDLIVEPDETFTVTLGNPNNGASLGNATAIGTITNDDSCAAGTTAPVLDNSVPTAYCDTINRDLDDYTNSPIPPNSELLWSTNSDPLVVADHLVGSIATAAGSYYGFFYDSLNDCASATLQVTLTLNTSPFAGSDVNAFACNSTDTGGSTTLDLDEQLTGEDPGGTWTITTDPSGGMTIGAGNVVDFSGLAVNSVYEFTYTTNNAVAPCVNDTAAVTVTVTDCTCPAGNVAPVLDTSVPTAFCDVVSQDLNEYTQSVAPTGTTLTWSTNSDPTVANAHIFSDVDAPGTYYGFFYDADDNCGSPVLTVNLTINTTPEVLTTIPGSRCGIGTVTLGGTRDPGAVLNWYDSETGGTFLGTGTSFVTPSIDTTTTFYVEATANGCTSERTAVIATVYEQPIAGIANNTTACSLVDGFTTVDLNSRLVGADPGVWSITTVPTGATVAIGPGDVVDFAAQPDGDYIFTYTTNTAQAPCTDASTTLTVSVSPLDCGPDDIDLELVKDVDMGTVDVGGQVVFTLTLTNLSDVEVTNIVVSDPIGIGFGFAYVTSTPVGAYNNLTGEWTIDTLEPLGMRTLQIIASVPVEGTFTNTASITASFPNDGNPLNNESSVNVEVLPTVCLRIFNQISPNGDGINDELIINCIRNYKNNKLEIFDRYGNKVFSKTNYDNTWSGTGKNGDLPKGTYFYSLDLGDGSAARTGWIQIIR